MELVSNTKGHELDEKLEIYQKMRVSYYIVYDSNKHLGEQVLRVYNMFGRHYVETTKTWFEDIRRY